MGYKLREIETESKFSQELNLALIEWIAPHATIAAVLIVERTYPKQVDSTTKTVSRLVKGSFGFRNC